MIDGRIRLLSMPLDGAPVATVQGSDGVLRRVLLMPSDVAVGGTVDQQGWGPTLQELRRRWEQRESDGQNLAARQAITLERIRQDRIDASELARASYLAAVKEQVGEYADEAGTIYELAAEEAASLVDGVRRAGQGVALVGWGAFGLVGAWALYRTFKD